MCRARRVSAALFVAVAFALCERANSVAQVITTADDEARVLLFSGRDLWRNGAFAHGGLLLAPGGVDRDGFTLKLVLTSGFYRYIGGGLAGEPPGSLAGWQIVGAETGLLVGAETGLQVMPGWRIKRGALEVKVNFGLDFETHWLWPDDPNNRLRGHDTGLRFAAEFWYEPTPTTMAAGDASLSIASKNTLRLAYGWRLLDQFYVGSAMQFYGADGYRQWRVGGHFTALKTADNEWLAAGGWARDSAGLSSPYVRLGVTMRR